MQIVIAGAPGTGAEELALSLRQALIADGLTDLEVGLATELIHAVKQDLLFGAPTGCAAALSRHKETGALTLLTGLDQSIVDPHSPSEDLVLSAQLDAGLRTALDTGGVQYTVLLGPIGTRTKTALQAIAHAKNRSTASLHTGPSRWHWDCGCCSDADCERKLFTSLLAASSVWP